MRFQAAFNIAYSLRRTIAQTTRQPENKKQHFQTASTIYRHLSPPYRAAHTPAVAIPDKFSTQMQIFTIYLGKSPANRYHLHPFTFSQYL